MKAFFKFLFILFLFAIIAGSFASYKAYEQYNFAINQNLNFSEETLSLTVPKGTPLITLLNNLEKQGILQDMQVVRLKWKLFKDSFSIKSGNYTIKKNTNFQDFLQILNKGQVDKFYITFIPGTTFKQIKQVLDNNQNLEHKLLNANENDIKRELNINEEKLEGLFYPDTYQFEQGMTDVDILKISHNKLQTVLNEQWEKRDLENTPYKNPYEALIMASMVEKETGAKGERDRIAGVFVRRLSIGMKLQTDPTVIYGLGDEYKGNITRKHLQTPTAYNTYVINGMPPSPIAAVAFEAIYAAMHPLMADNALYFVAKGDGSHYFSASLNEHNNAVRQYQLTRKENYRSAPKQEENKNE